MKELFLVAFGGAFGSVLRWKLSQLTFFNLGKFPINTFITNILATAVLGAVMFLFVRQSAFPKEIKLLIAVGFCGGLSTFSTFSLETFELIRSGDYWQAVAYPVLSLAGGLVVLGLIAKWA